MTSNNELLHLQNEVQLLMGKCLLNYQLIEHRMKFIIQFGSIEIYRGENGELNTRHSDDKKMTLGNLFNTYIDKHVRIKAKPVVKKDVIPENGTLMTTSFHQIFDSHESKIEWCKSIATLIKDRNILVHHFTERYPLDEIDKCQQAMKYLRIKNEFCIEHCNRLKQLCLEIQDTLKSFADHEISSASLH